MAGGALFRVYARVVLVGFWGLLVGLVTVVGAAKALAATSGGALDSPGLSRAGYSLTPLAVGVFGGLFDAGVASLGVGAVVMTVGTRFCLTSVKARG